MPTTRQATQRAARVRTLVLWPRLQKCQAFFAANTGEQVDKCGRIATARQTYTPLTGGPDLDTFRCGSHRIPLIAPDLVSTTTSLSGFVLVVAS